MFLFASSTYKKLFFTYITIVVLLLVLPLNGTLRLSNVYFGFRSDHIVHCFIFTPFISLCFLGKLAPTTRRLLVFGYTFASLCEFLHVFIPYRTASIFDLLANYIGVTIGFLLFKLAQRYRLIPILEA